MITARAAPAALLAVTLLGFLVGLGLGMPEVVTSPSLVLDGIELPPVKQRTINRSSCFSR